jgi:hypothetical protein
MKFLLDNSPSYHSNREYSLIKYSKIQEILQAWLYDYKNNIININGITDIIALKE